MKRAVNLIWILIFLFSSLNAQSGKAKSLEIGNRWIYHKSDGSGFSEEVIKDTSINNKLYAVVLSTAAYDLKFERADSIRLYAFSNGFEFTEVDFSYEIGDTITIYPELTISFKDTVSLWGELLVKIGYHWDFGYQDDWMTYLEKVGLLNAHGIGMAGGGFYSYTLVSALIGNNFYGDSTLLDIKKTEKSIITNFGLSQNYPNPFNSETNIRFRLNKFGKVNLIVYDILGNEIARLLDEEMPPGEYSVLFDAENYHLSSGIYFYNLNTHDGIVVKKMVYLK